MVTRTAVIEGYEQTVITPIIKEVTNAIQNSFIRDPNTFNYLITKYEKENDNVPDFKVDNTIGGPTLDIEYEYKPTDEINIRTSRMFPLSKPILFDRETQFAVTPYFQQQELTINFRFRGQSKQELINIKNKLYSYYINTDYRLILNLPYNFQLPLSVLFLANDIKTLKEFDGSIDEYLETIKTEHLDFSLKRGWKDFRLPYFRGLQVSRYCNIMTPPEEIEVAKDDQPEYGVSFSVLTTFYLPVGVFVDIPMLVNNKPVDSKWLGREHVVEQVCQNTNIPNMVKAISDYYFGYKTTNDILFKYPDNDEFTLALNPNRHMYEINWLSVLTQLDKNNPKLLFNLNDLSYIGVPTDIIDYMKKYNAPWISNLWASSVKLTLFEDNAIKDKELYIDKDYNIKVKKDLDLTKRYHVIFSFITDLNLLNTESRELKEDTKRLYNKYGIFWFNTDGEVLRHRHHSKKGDN